MKNICFYFQVHQPFRLKDFTFFDIGNDDQYFDEHANKSIMRKVASKCYLPMNQLLLELIEKYNGEFRVSFSISGTAFKQFEMYAPDVLESFIKLSKTGCVEFIAETFSHSLSALKSEKEFKSQVKEQIEYNQKYFNTTPKVFRNTELIYSNEIGAMVYDMGFETMITEGAEHKLGWKSPNYIYNNPIRLEQKLLLKNFKLSDDIAFRFSNRQWEEWPLLTDKYVSWIDSTPDEEKIINLFMDYETFGEHQWEDSGIFDFMRDLPEQVLRRSNHKFTTVSETANNNDITDTYDVHEPISWADAERDLTAWLGNDLQDDAFLKLYETQKRVIKCNDEKLNLDWRYLQTSDHFYYMCTKWFADGDVHKYFNPYESPYTAYTTFMNVLSDFTIRLDKKLEQRKLMKLKHISSKDILIPSSNIEILEVVEL